MGGRGAGQRHAPVVRSRRGARLLSSQCPRRLNGAAAPPSPGAVRTNPLSLQMSARGEINTPDAARPRGIAARESRRPPRSPLPAHSKLASPSAPKGERATRAESGRRRGHAAPQAGLRDIDLGTTSQQFARRNRWPRTDPHGPPSTCQESGLPLSALIRGGTSALLGEGAVPGTRPPSFGSAQRPGSRGWSRPPQVSAGTPCAPFPDLKLSVLPSATRKV